MLLNRFQTRQTFCPIYRHYRIRGSSSADRDFQKYRSCTDGGLVTGKLFTADPQRLNLLPSVNREIWITAMQTKTSPSQSHPSSRWRAMPLLSWSPNMESSSETSASGQLLVLHSVIAGLWVHMFHAESSPQSHAEQLDGNVGFVSRSLRLSGKGSVHHHPLSSILLLRVCSLSLVLPSGGAIGVLAPRPQVQL